MEYLVQLIAGALAVVVGQIRQVLAVHLVVVALVGMAGAAAEVVAEQTLEALLA